MEEFLAVMLVRWGCSIAALLIALWAAFRGVRLPDDVRSRIAALDADLAGLERKVQSHIMREKVSGKQGLDKAAERGIVEVGKDAEGHPIFGYPGGSPISDL